MKHNVIRKETRCHDFFTIQNPNSRSVLFWDSFGCLLVGVDMILIPLENFPLTADMWLFGMHWFGLVFWTGDILRNFSVGVETSDYRIEMDPYKIALHYLRKSFFMDLCVLIIEMVNFGSSPSMRITRIFRSIRLVRVVKMWKVFKVLHDRVPHVFVVPLKALLTIFIILYTTHVTCCGWYRVAVSEDVPHFLSDGHEGNWLSHNGHHDEKDFTALYTMSLFWASGQSGVGSVNIYPTNRLEHVYATVVCLLWQVVTALFVAIFVQLSSDFRRIQKETYATTETLRHFFRQAEGRCCHRW